MVSPVISNLSALLINYCLASPPESAGKVKEPEITKGKASTPRPDVMSYRQQQHAKSALGIQYPKGVIKKTWAFGFPRENDIKIEEVLQKNDLDLAVLSAFQWDDEWIASKIDMNNTKLVCVVQSQDETHVGCIKISQSLCNPVSFIVAYAMDTWKPQHKHRPFIWNQLNQCCGP